MTSQDICWHAVERLCKNERDASRSVVQEEQGNVHASVFRAECDGGSMFRHPELVGEAEQQEGTELWFGAVARRSGDGHVDACLMPHAHSLGVEFVEA